MAKEVDSWTNDDGTGAIVSKEGDDTIISHFIPGSGYPKGTGRVTVSMPKGTETRPNEQPQP